MFIILNVLVFFLLQVQQTIQCMKHEMDKRNINIKRSMSFQPAF